MTASNKASCPPAVLTLPYELWLNVLRHFELRPLDFGNTRAHAGFVARQAVLCSLSLTSHRLLDIARPLLYGTVVLPFDGSNASARRCLRLLRTLSQNPALGRLVVSLAVPLHLTDNPKWWEASKSLLPLCQVHQDYRKLLSLSGLDDVIGCKDHDQIPQILLALLISLAPNLQRLLINAPHDTKQPSMAMGNALERILLSGDADSDIVQPLQKLSILQLQQDPVSLQSEAGESASNLGNNGLKAILPILKARASHLKRLDLSDQCLEDWNADQTATELISKIKEINLINLDHPAHVTVFIRAAKRLDTLSLHLTHRAQQSLPPESTDFNDDYNVTILEKKDTLRSLSFTAPDYDAEELGYLLGPLGRLTCLTQLENLQFLRVEPHLLIDWLEVNTWPRFWDALPRNLVKLVFRFRTRNEDMTHIWARSGVGAALRASKSTWQKKMPRLQAICLEPLPYGARVADELVEDLRLAGITLTWVYEL